MKKRPSISEDELTQLMDFNRVLAGYRQHQAVSIREGRILIGTGLVAVIALVTYLAWQSAPPTVELQRQEKFNETAAQPTAIPTDSMMSESAPDRIKQPSDKLSKKAHQLPPKVVESVPPTYTPAQPVQGYEVLYAYFQQELHYPESALADSIEGVVTVSFLINKRGEPEQVKVEQSLGALFDEEAVRLVRNMPPWAPARLGTEPTLSKLSLPITFRIEK